jgi:hypothetical protein
LLLTRRVGGVEDASHFPEVLAGMKQIDNLHSSRKVLVRKVPDPLGSVSDDDLLSARVQPRFQASR